VSTDAPALTRARQRPRAELILAVLAALSLLLNFVHLTTIYEGLPAHPLFLHVPVVLIPTVCVAALVFSVRTDWFGRWGVALGVLTVIALAGLGLTEGAGSALQNALGLQGGIIAQHIHAAHILRWLFVAFTALLLATLYAYRSPRPEPARAGLRIVLSLVALVSLYYVWRTGDLGAKAVWYARLHHFGGPGGGFPGGGFPGGFGGSPGG
jgi:hypothetical protein